MVDSVAAHTHGVHERGVPPRRAAPSGLTRPGDLITRSPGDQAVHSIAGFAEIPALAVAIAARGLYSEHSSTDDTLCAITAAAAQLIPGADSASAALPLGKTELSFRAATDAHAAAADDVQRSVGDGPTRHSIRNRTTVVMSDVFSESRWVALSTIILRDTVIRSALCLPLYIGTDVLGAITVYAQATDAFSAQSVDVATAFAAHAALALLHSTHDEQLAQALASRDSIGQAKGMIMERYDIDAPHAFAMLSKISQHTNTPVTVLAGRLTRREDRRRPHP